MGIWHMVIWSSEQMDGYFNTPSRRGRQIHNNINGKFISFTVKLAGGKPAHGHPDPAQEFLQHWGLNEDAVGWFQRLPVDLQENAMSSFNPPADTRDVAARVWYLVEQGNAKSVDHVEHR